MTAAAAFPASVEAQLRARVDYLEAEVRVLRGQLGLEITADQVARVSRRYGIYPAPARLLIALYNAKGRVLGRELLDAAIEPADRAADVAGKLLHVQVCRARHAIGRDALENVHGVGYRMSPVGRERLRVVLEGQR